MHKVQQSRTGRDGDCLAACVASIFEVGIDEVPDLTHSGRWPEALMTWLRPRGMGFLYVDERGVGSIGGLTIGSMQFSSGNRHCVVMLDGQVAWDPYPGGPRTFPDASRRIIQSSWIVFTVLDPSLVAKKQ